MMSSLAHPEIVLITLWSNQWVSAEINLFGTKTDLTQKYLQRKIFWKDCEQTLRKNIFLWMMGLSIVLASVHIEENEKKYLFHLCMNALISASRLPSLHSRGFPCCGIETGSRQGKTGDHTNIRRREKVGIGLSPKIVSIFAQSGG